MKIIGLRIEKYIDKEISDHNCDFEYNDSEFEKHIICAVLSDNRKVEIELSNSVGECMSGWTSASWGHISVTEVKMFNGYTHSTNCAIIVNDIEPGYSDDVSNYYFSVDCDGGCNYYPSGYYSVDMNLFEETVRHKNMRPIWIFKGKSNAGKSFLASKLTNLDVYETDISDELPSVITESVIVLGNKYKFTIEHIKSKIFGKFEIQIVDFI